MRWKENYPATIFLKNGPSPVINSHVSGKDHPYEKSYRENFSASYIYIYIYIYIEKHAYNGTIGIEVFPLQEGSVLYRYLQYGSLGHDIFGTINIFR